MFKCKLVWLDTAVIKSIFLKQVNIFSFINMAKLVHGVYQKVKHLQKSVIFYELHPFVCTKKKQRLFLTKRNSTPLLQKLSYFSLSRQSTLTQVEPRSKSFVFLLVPLYINSFTVLGIAYGVLNQLNISHHNLVVSPHVEEDDPCPPSSPWTCKTNGYRQSSAFLDIPLSKSPL